MTVMRSLRALVILSLTSVAVGSRASGPAHGAPESAIDRAFARYWRASNPRDAERAADDVLKTGIDFDSAFARLKSGRPYDRSVQTGAIVLSVRSSDLMEHRTRVRIPADYDPSTPSPVRVQLHGGVNRRQEEERPRDRPNPIEGAREIYVLPTATADAAWWHYNQVENILSVLDQVKRTYNVDENRVHLTGISDGATGAYFMALKDTTPWSSFLPLIGHLRVLSSGMTGVDGELYLSNLVNKPFFVVNGGRDPLYPTSSVDAYMRLLERLGVTVVYHPLPESGHSVDWWPEERDEFEAFVESHLRDPLPDTLSWTTERTDRYNRAHWLVITRLGESEGDAIFPDDNTVEQGPRDFGVRLTSDQSVARIQQVVGGSDAAALGLVKGDLIIEINGRAIHGSGDLVDALSDHELGTPLSFVVERDGRREVLEKTFPPPPGIPVFRHRKPAGRVDLVRSGNTVTARTKGVRTFVLLISPDRFDFSNPIKVVVNDRVAFEGLVKKDVTSLLHWAARDNDRTMLFGAEVSIDAPPAVRPGR